MKINPRTITYVMAVAEEHSFSKAAEKLCITQPSLSQHILNAEKEYGVQFFNRKSVPVTLTFAGERFISTAMQMNLLDAKLTREMEDLSGNIKGRIVVGASPTRGAWFIPSLFSKFKADFPQIELVLKEGSNVELLECVKTGKVDFAFVGYTEPGLNCMKISSREILLAMRKSDPFVSRFDPLTPIDLKEFRHRPFILLNKGRGIRKMADHLFEKCGIAPDIAYETGSYNMALQMAREGLGCTFVINHEIQQMDEMVTYFIDGADETYQLLLVYEKESYLSKPLQHFIDLAVKIEPYL